MKNESFEDRWRKVEERATQRLRNDKSLETLKRKYTQLAKRLQRAEQAINSRQNQIFVEEIKKEFWKQT